MKQGFVGGRKSAGFTLVLFGFEQGVLRDPVKNIWVIEFGMICCVLVIPLALIAGPIREIPFWWRVIDCSFAVAIVPLYFGRKWVLELENL